MNEVICLFLNSHRYVSSSSSHRWQMTQRLMLGDSRSQVTFHSEDNQGALDYSHSKLVLGSNFNSNIELIINMGLVNEPWPIVLYW